jgi:membrane-associated phospholipid phosphatase
MAQAKQDKPPAQAQAPPRGLLAGLNLVDILYLGYLFLMAILAAAHTGRWAAFLLGHTLIGACIVALGWNARRSPAIRFLHDWYPLAMFIFCFEEVARFSLAVVPYWQDHRLVALEQAVFGVSPNLWVSRFYSPWLSELMDLGYFSYYPMFPVVGGLLYAGRDKRSFRELMLASVLMYFLAFAIYLLFPTAGPRHSLGGLVLPPHGGPFNWLVRTIQGHAGVHGNAFPSSHVGLAVLCVVFAWRAGNKRMTFVLGLGLIGICAGAVYDGYHYFIDVAGGILVALVALVIHDRIPGSGESFDVSAKGQELKTNSP